MKRALLALSLAVLSASLAAQPYPAFNQLPANPPSTWVQAQSWQIYTLGNGLYRAEIRYVDQTNQEHRAQYQGDVDSLRLQINQDSQLPLSAKQVLLQALNPQPLVFSPFWFGPNPFIPPWGNQWMFNIFQSFPALKP